MPWGRERRLAGKLAPTRWEKGDTKSGIDRIEQRTDITLKRDLKAQMQIVGDVLVELKVMMSQGEARMVWRAYLQSFLPEALRDTGFIDEEGCRIKKVTAKGLVEAPGMNRLLTDVGEQVMMFVATAPEIDPPTMKTMVLGVGGGLYVGTDRNRRHSPEGSMILRLIGDILS